jgi:nitrite reductase (NO-forming)
MRTDILKTICATALGSALLAAPVLAQESEIKASGAKPNDPAIRGEETAVLTEAPNVPLPITRDHPTKVRE